MKKLSIPGISGLRFRPSQTARVRLGLHDTTVIRSGHAIKVHSCQACVYKDCVSYLSIKFFRRDKDTQKQ